MRKERTEQSPKKARSAFHDIHCHILPALDDGASSLNESVAMAAAAAADGIRTIVATPHADPEHPGSILARVVQECERLNRRLQRENIALQVLPGADIRINENLADALRAGVLPTVANARRYVLLEMPQTALLNITELLSELRGRGLRVVLTHPERNMIVQDDLRLLEPLISGGCLMQLTAASITGIFGSKARHTSRELLRRNMAHVVATDAHSAEGGRRPALSQAYRTVASWCGQAVAEKLFCENPWRIIRGMEINPQPPLPPRRSWYARLRCTVG